MTLGKLFGTTIARVCAAIIQRVPLGYQDETGFHFGVPRFAVVD